MGIHKLLIPVGPITHVHAQVRRGMAVQGVWRCVYLRYCAILRLQNFPARLQGNATFGPSRNKNLVGPIETPLSSFITRILELHS